MARTILTIDDCPHVRERLLLVLTRAGYRVIQAEDGIHGLEMLYEEKPDMIVTDLDMPRLDGVGLIEGVRYEERYRTLPIFVLMKKNQKKQKRRLSKMGIADWIPEKIEDEALLTLIHQHAA